ncbi:MAG: hypothetical protein J6333_03070, partial [Planctomycetes bacterium]|nr:hypothetical protein [Planctomycetota bacterium]
KAATEDNFNSSQANATLLVSDSDFTAGRHGFRLAGADALVTVERSNLTSGNTTIYTDGGSVNAQVIVTDSILTVNSGNALDMRGANSVFVGTNSEFHSTGPGDGSRTIRVSGADSQLTFVDSTLISPDADVFMVEGEGISLTMSGGSATINGSGKSVIYLPGGAAGSTVRLAQGAELHAEIGGNNNNGIYNTAADTTLIIDEGSSIAATNMGIYNNQTGVKAVLTGGSAIVSNGYGIENRADDVTLNIDESSAIVSNSTGIRNEGADVTVVVDGGSSIAGSNHGIFNNRANVRVVVANGSSIACGPNENSYAIHNVNGSNGSLVAIGKGSLVNSLDNPGWIGIETESSWNSINVAGVVQGSNHALHVKNGGTPRGNVFNLMNGAVIEHSQWGLKNECPEEAYTSFITFGYAPGTNPNANDWLAAAGTGIGDGALTKVDNKAVITVNDSILGADAGSRWVAYVAAGTTILNGTARANFIRDLYVGAAGFEERQLIATADGPRTATRIVPVKGAKATLVVGEGVNLTAMDNLNIYQGGTLQVAGTLNVPNAFAIDGGALQVDATGTADVVKALAVEGGTVTVNGTMAAHDALTVTGGKLAVGAGGTVDAAAAVAIEGGEAAINGTLNVAGALALTNAKTTVGAGGSVDAAA